MCCLLPPSFRHYFNTSSARRIQETTVTSADYTILVHGLKRAKLLDQTDVAIAFASAVQDAWETRRRNVATSWSSRAKARLGKLFRPRQGRQGRRARRAVIGEGWWFGGEKNFDDGQMRACARTPGSQPIAHLHLQPYTTGCLHQCSTVRAAFHVPSRHATSAM